MYTKVMLKSVIGTLPITLPVIANDAVITAVIATNSTTENASSACAPASPRYSESRCGDDSPPLRKIARDRYQPMTPNARISSPPSQRRDSRLRETAHVTRKVAVMTTLPTVSLGKSGDT